MKTTIITLLKNGVTQHEIHRKAGVDRKTIRHYGREAGLIEAGSKSPPSGQVVTGEGGQNPPGWPPDGGVSKQGSSAKIPKHARSACEPYRQWIEEQVRLKRNGQSIYQDLVEKYGVEFRYNSVKRFVRGLKRRDPEQYDRLEFDPGEECQVDFGKGALTRHPSTGKYRRPWLFVMTLRYSRRAFRKVVWKADQRTWCRLHEQAWRYFGGTTTYVVLDNLKQGVLKPDIYDPELNPLYEALCSHYRVVPDPCRVEDLDRKGSVESAIKHTQDTALKGRRYESIEEQNDWLMHWEERWAAPRVHGRMKRQVEAMYQEEKPFLKALPVKPFLYFDQRTCTVWEDALVQVDSSYYCATPLPLYSQAVVRLYDLEVEILDPKTMAVVRRHVRATRRGSVYMDEGERIFNPSRKTKKLIRDAEKIGPQTKALFDKWFTQDGRMAQRRMWGVVGLVRRHKAVHVEWAATVAVRNNITSVKAIRNMVERAEKAEKKVEKKGNPQATLTQSHELIREPSEYGRFWEMHAQQEIFENTTVH